MLNIVKRSNFFASTKGQLFSTMWVKNRGDTFNYLPSIDQNMMLDSGSLSLMRGWGRLLQTNSY